MQRKDVLFNLSNRTLAATNEWRYVIRLGFLFAGLSFIYNIYWMDIPKIEKTLFVVSIMFLCYSAVNLAIVVRNREEGYKLQQYAKATDLYVTSNIQTLIGSDIKYAFQYLGFGIALISMITSVTTFDMSSERRGNFILSAILLLIMSFLNQKDIRDKEDADKWHTDYHK